MPQQEPDDPTQAIRQTLWNEWDSYVYNNLPTYLLDIRNLHNSVDHHDIRLSDISLVSRNQIAEDMRTQIEADLRAIWPFNREKWCEARIRDYKDKHRYAILSHHWGGGEHEFQQMCNPEYPPEERSSSIGVQKLLGFCKVAATEYRCQYAWSDTCCIDKKSSSELAEAIRSMYRWYEGSEICIVYLGASSVLDDHKRCDPWFKRGWTLQELLAPKTIKFYGKDWTPINGSSASHPNDKEDDSMRTTLEEITGIPSDDIRNFRPSHDRVSEKMTWMATRQTRRVEDIAYSLFGIFDVTMDIAYGEGNRAFSRFMRVLADRCLDPGFLAWCGESSPDSLALPVSPSCYQLGGERASLLELGGYSSSQVHSGDSYYTITKKGLEVKALIVPIDESKPPSLDCAYILPAKQRMAIPADNTHANMKLRRRWRLFPTKKGGNEALGIINYRPVAPDYGKVSANSRYFCLLLERHGSEAWRKKRTKRVVVLRCEGTLKDKVETITLIHNNQIQHP